MPANYSLFTILLFIILKSASFQGMASRVGSLLISLCLLRKVAMSSKPDDRNIFCAYLLSINGGEGLHLNPCINDHSHLKFVHVTLEKSLNLYCQGQ